MALTLLTLVHVAISLIGIFSGVVVVCGLLSAKGLERWTAVFLFIGLGVFAAIRFQKRPRISQLVTSYTEAKL